MKDPIEILLGLGSVVLSAFGFLGQAEVIDTSYGLITQFGGLGLAVWLVIHHTTKTIPGMQASHQAERQAERKAFQDQLLEERKDHAAEITRQREQFAEMMSRVSCKFTKGT